MTWVLAAALALAAFAAGAALYGAVRAQWAMFGAALAVGLAGYGLQASPTIAGAPAKPQPRSDEALGWSLVDARKEVIADAARSRSDRVLIADALARRGQYSNAAAMLNSAVAENPRDAEAWLALGNALVEHAEGNLTAPALLAYRRASAVDPQGIGPGYFLGLALIRQGQLGDARNAWAATLEGAAPDAAGRAAMEERLARLDALLAQAAAGGPLSIPEQR